MYQVQFLVKPSTPFTSNLCSRPQWDTLSNALAMSKKLMSTGYLLLKFNDRLEQVRAKSPGAKTVLAFGR